MKNLFIILFSVIGCLCFGQENLCRTNLIDQDELISENKLDEYLNYDFSTVWTQTKNQSIYGIIGSEYQRIHIKFLSVTQNKEKPNEYLVLGKSMVKENICNFQGKIIIKRIQERKNLYFGVDNELINEIKNQGILIASYQFFENKNQTYAGTFEGTLQSKWLLNSQDLIQYDNADLISDGYFNNAFVGTWKSHDTKDVKICNWGDYRVPHIDCAFDIGTAEFSVNAEKYATKGWLDIILANTVSCFKFQNSSPPENYISKEWWE